MAYAKVSAEFIVRKIDHLKSVIELNQSRLLTWNVNHSLHLLGRDIYVNRQGDSITSEPGVIPAIVKAPCRFATREEIVELVESTEIQLSIYKMFLEAIDNGDFLMVDDDHDKNGLPGYQLFRKKCPTIDVLKVISE